MPPYNLDDCIIIEYHFFVDFDGNLNDSAVKNAIRGIMEEAVNFKILGNY